jgi:hypothetical protein
MGRYLATAPEQAGVALPPRRVPAHHPKHKNLSIGCIVAGNLQVRNGQGTGRLRGASQGGFPDGLFQQRFDDLFLP